jgi:hypothetical protein
VVVSSWRERIKEAKSRVKAAKVELPSVEPFYPATSTVHVDTGRQELNRVINHFFSVAEKWNDHRESENLFIKFAMSQLDAPAHGVKASTGIGKTEQTVARLAKYFRAKASTRPWLYLVPTHRLGEKVADDFRALHERQITTGVYRSRRADDPAIPGNLDRPKHERVKMCLALEKVKLAEMCGQDPEKTCCKNKQRQCEFYNECGFQRQMRGDRPQVIIAAHNMLFHPHRYFKDLAGVILDETFYQKGMRGFEVTRRDEDDDGFTLSDLVADHRALPLDGGSYWRDVFIEMLHRHPPGGLQRDFFVGKIRPQDCTENKKDEWEIIRRMKKLTPEMSLEQIAELEEEAFFVRRTKFMAGVWHELRELLQSRAGTVSGRLVLIENKKKQRMLRCYGHREVIEALKLPTLILDATLPDAEIIHIFYPQVEQTADIEVEMSPHVHVRQIYDAPVSQRKLFGTKNKQAKERHLKAVRRYVLQRWVETGRQKTLVICQKQAEDWLKKAGLPHGIATEHFNNLSGLDHHKDARLEILVGRTIPSPKAMEAQAGALTGIEPAEKIVRKPEGRTNPWYEEEIRGIRLEDGSGIAVKCNKHPDKLTEALRWQACEAELVQAIGRARAVNREAHEPLDIDILLPDAVLPVTVDKGMRWKEPSPMVEMAAEGVVLTNPKDMSEAWPQMWATADAAKKALQRARRGNEGHFSSISILLENCPSFQRLLYRTARRGRPVAAFYDPALVPDPRAWLENKLGPLASLSFEGISLLAAGGEVEARITVSKVHPQATLDRLLDLDAAQNRRQPIPARKFICEAVPHYGTAKATPEWHARPAIGVIRKYPPVHAMPEHHVQ